MRKIIKLILFLILLITQSNLYAIERYFVLYGLKLGQKMSIASELYGKPFKSDKFQDGFRYEAFKINDHILIVEANNTRPDLIWGIQIQGKSNPEHFGINGINLSDTDTKIIESFGKPDEIRDSIDEITKNKVPGIKYYSYDTKSNFSIETQNNLVTSIKITFNGYNQSNDEYDIKTFIDLLKSKNIYQISNRIASDFILKKNENYLIQKTIIDTLTTKNEISDFLMNSETGLISLNKKDILETIPIKNKENNIIAYYFKVSLNNSIVHIFFLRSFEGWILKEVNFNNN